MSSLGFEIMIKLGVAFALLAVSFLMAFTAVGGALRHGRRIEERLAGGSSFDVEAAPVEMGLLEKFGSHLSLPGAEDITRLRHKLARAGYYDPSAVRIYYALRLICIVVPVLLLLIFMGHLVFLMGLRLSFFLVAAVMVVGTLGPDMFIRWRQGRRQRLCREGFPDMMDLLVASIEAGLGMDAALVRVAQEVGGRHPDLKVDLDLMNLELRAGRNRHDSMANFADRVDLEEARALGVMVKQAEEMGSSLGAALRTFSEDMRMKRMLRAEEKAMALSAKLTVPLILFIFPTLMIMLMLPAVIRISEEFGT
jgi:tight adherence protein C